VKDHISRNKGAQNKAQIKCG